MKFSFPILALTCAILSSLSALAAPTKPQTAPEKVKVHGIFRSHMVIQRDEPITIWGWAPAGTEVEVAFGNKTATSMSAGEAGRWEVIFDPQAANSEPQTLIVKGRNVTVKMENILIGDVWVMNGQSNMAFGLKAVYQAGFESAQAHLPQLRHFRIQSGAESEYVETDLNEDFIFGKDVEDKNWRVVTPETSLDMGAIGFIFGSRLQRALQIPIGIIDNSRGGASLESLVPRHKFADDAIAAEYLKWVDGRRAEFSFEDFHKAQMDKWKSAEERYQKEIAADKEKGVTKKRRRPRKPDGSIRTWSVPGRSPSDAAACYNGMFGVFKGLNIKGVAFHQGFNNAMMNSSCKPKFYRRLMKLMVDGWRDDFGEKLPVAIIGLCAGGNAQTRLNFEQSGLSTAAYIRESQQLGLMDAEDQTDTVFIPAYDQKIPQLHTKKKKELGLRTARWALNTLYGMESVVWETGDIVSAVPEEGKMLLTFDKPVRVDDFGSEIEGFSLADSSGTYYMAEAVYLETKDKNERFKQILVSSPLVKEPASVRYAWSRAPMGNLKVNGIPWQPLPSFRTDKIDFSAEVTHQDPDGGKKNSDAVKILKAAAAEALKTRLEACEK
jgi:sialate O-acetylesterase|tara:strand:+ start:4654 stop:6477 length:1824 start_codon:yes stop_codon:yes gene_type:complete